MIWKLAVNCHWRMRSAKLQNYGMREGMQEYKIILTWEANTELSLRKDHPTHIQNKYKGADWLLF